MASGKIKLFKIASDINIGKEAIVEFLQSKGFQVDNKPTATLSDEMVDVVYDKFKKEKKAAEVQRTKIQKHKDFKKPNDDYDLSEVEEKLSRVSAQINEIHARQHQQAADEEAYQIAEQKAKEEEQAKIAHQKQAEIDKQEAKIRAKELAKQQEAEALALEKAKPKKAKKTTVEEPISESKTEETVEASDSKAEISEMKIQKKSKVKPDSSSEEADSHEESKSTADSVEAIDSESDTDSKGGKKKKKRKPADVELGDKSNLKGLTIVGKIQLYKDKPQNNDNRGRDNRGDNRGGDNRGRDNRGDVRRDDRGPRPDNRGGDNRGDNRGPRQDNRAADNRGPRQDNREPRPDNRGGQGGGYNRDNRDNRPSGENRGNTIGANFNRDPRIDPRAGQTGGGGYNRDNRDSRPDNRGGNQGGGGYNRDNRPAGDNRGNTGGQGGGGYNRDQRPDNRGGQGGGGGYNRDNRPAGDNRGGSGGGSDYYRGNRDVYRHDPFAIFTDVPKTTDPSPLDKKKKLKDKPILSIEDESKAKAALDAKAIKKKRKKSIRDSISQVDVDRAIRETLAGMDDSVGGSFKAKLRQKKKLEREEKEQKILEEKERESMTLELTEFVTTSDLANLMKVNASDIILKCMQLGLMVTINQRLDKETITLIADDYGFTVNFLEEEVVSNLDDDDDDEDELEPRSPIVTIMGHVDHGKTSLLDYIRKTRVVAGESGGITQHLGAYMVNHNDKGITFLDTPGHEAFTAMRARGAKVTDIVVLVVAADDNVMPQTIEAISHAKAAEVPIIVAINKIDKPDSKPDTIRQQLSNYDVLVEDWGGKYQVVEISAKFGTNVETLLDKILLEAEILELKANPNRRAKGTVIESNMEKGLGTVTTIIVQKGTLNVGDPFVAGVAFGRVRALLDERGNKITSAGPSHPVRVIGFDELPTAGDIFFSSANESEAREIAIHRKQLKREQELRQVRHITLDDISAQILIGGVKTLNLIIKTDVSGSLEALSDSLQKLSQSEVQINVLHKGVGNITESDVMLAAASGAVVIGFHVSTNGKAQRIADSENVDIRHYEIIYDCINEIQMALEGMLSPEIKEETGAEVEVRQVFKTSKIGNIAGCMVLSGKINRNDKVRLLRDGIPIYTGSIHTLKRFKDDVREVETGFECGVALEGFTDIQVNDIIQSFKQVEVKRFLKGNKK